MNAGRGAWALVVALMLAACANTAPPEPLAPAEPDTRTDPVAPAQAATTVVPAQAATTVVPAEAGTQRRGAGWDPRLRGEKPPPAPPTGGPTPPQRVAHACKVDADCVDKPHCQGTTCRCVKNTCIAAKQAIDPVIDPAPVPPPET
jgi:hypothetical protein